MRRPLLVALAVLVSALLSTAPAFASAAPEPAAHPVPSELTPPAGQKLVLTALGTGVQVYDCNATTGRWTFREPVATLQRRGRTIGIHYVGPTWELFDGSKVTAAVEKSVLAPNPARDIPWLLLKATSNAGSGALSKVDYIQRLFTRGGVAPDGGVCDPAEDTSVGVRYSAVYAFYSGRA